MTIGTCTYQLAGVPAGSQVDGTPTSCPDVLVSTNGCLDSAFANYADLDGKCGAQTSLECLLGTISQMHFPLPNPFTNVNAECCIVILPPQPTLQALPFGGKIRVDATVQVITSLNTCEARRSLTDWRELQANILMTVEDTKSFTKVEEELPTRSTSFLDIIMNFLAMLLRFFTFGLLG